MGARHLGHGETMKADGGMTDVAIQPSLFGMEQATTTSDDYYTPAWVFERLALKFALDVSAPPGGIPWIPADRYFTMTDDGLAQPWAGRVWMNPPYSNITPWVERFLDHGDGVALLPMAKSWWINRVMERADGIAISDKGSDHLTFHRPGLDRPVKNYYLVFFVAMGDECVEAISRLGRVRR
jgi:hypothetical protein